MQYKRIPHYDIAGAYQLITYRLGDSLPASVLKQFDIPESTGGTGGSPVKNQKTKKAENKRRKRIEQYLDAGHGSCILKLPEIAQLVIDNWLFFDEQRYDLVAYVLMPNHVHLLIKTFKQWLLRDVVHSWKSYTGKEIKKVFLKTGGPPVPPAFPDPIWQANYWDRFIRNEDHYYRSIQYIHNNPVKAELCIKPEHWKWSSIKWGMGSLPTNMGKLPMLL